jgi:hypothetical protein
MGCVGAKSVTAVLEAACTAWHNRSNINSSQEHYWEISILRIKKARPRAQNVSLKSKKRLPELKTKFFQTNQNHLEMWYRWNSKVSDVSYIYLPLQETIQHTYIGISAWTPGIPHKLWGTDQQLLFFHFLSWILPSTGNNLPSCTAM